VAEAHAAVEVIVAAEVPEAEEAQGVEGAEDDSYSGFVKK
jgi:hypothetical protein